MKRKAADPRWKHFFLARRQEHLVSPRSKGFVLLGRFPFIFLLGFFVLILPLDTQGLPLETRNATHSWMLTHFSLPPQLSKPAGSVANSSQREVGLSIRSAARCSSAHPGEIALQRLFPPPKGPATTFHLPVFSPFCFKTGVRLKMAFIPPLPCNS